MRIHSKVGLITNSSSETYTWLNEDYMDRLRAVGETIIKMLDLPGDFDQNFEIQRSINGNGIDAIRYNDVDWASPEVKQAVKDAWDATVDYKTRIEDAMRAVNGAIDLDAVPLGGYDSYNDVYRDSYLDVDLVSRATGVKLNIIQMFDSVYSTETHYNG